jgi:hypothetical protein
VLKKNPPAAAAAKMKPITLPESPAMTPTSVKWLRKPFSNCVRQSRFSERGGFGLRIFT